MSRLLIVLDLNGTLLQRLKGDQVLRQVRKVNSQIKEAAKIHGRPVILRPHVTPFLKSLLQNDQVDVAVWTSALPKNAVPMVMLSFGDLLSADAFTNEAGAEVAENYTNFKGRSDFPTATGQGRLAFLWSQSQCDIKGFQQGNRGKGDQKPDFIKNLQKIWTAFPDRFTPQNTLIIDDSAGKIVRAQEPNHLLIPEFDVERDPGMFGKDRTLERLEEYLKGMVEEKPADVREYLRTRPFNSHLNTLHS